MTGFAPNVAKPIVREISSEEVDRLREQYGTWKPDLGNRSTQSAPLLETRLDELQDKEKERAGKTYLVEWSGGKSPRGAQINGIAIGWTQNGFVTGTAGEQIGTYERLVESGGDSRQEQKIIIFASGVENKRDAGSEQKRSQIDLSPQQIALLERLRDGASLRYFAVHGGVALHSNTGEPDREARIRIADFLDLREKGFIEMTERNKLGYPHYANNHRSDVYRISEAGLKQFS